MKAILVIDMPIKCSDCPLFTCEDYDDFECEIGFCDNRNKLKIGEGRVKFDEKPPNWCPLKPLPNAITERGKWISEEYQKGWNAFRENLGK